MRISSVVDCEFLFRHLRVVRARDNLAIDVGGTEFVFLDTEVRRNPLYAVHPQLTLLDAGFNVDELSTRADEVVDMLDAEGTAHLRGRFDNVYSFDTLEHVSEPGRFCANLIALTRPGGGPTRWSASPDSSGDTTGAGSPRAGCPNVSPRLRRRAISSDSGSDESAGGTTAPASEVLHEPKRGRTERVDPVGDSLPCTCWL